MKSQKTKKNQQQHSEPLSFLEREAIIAASLGDHSGVTARPVGFMNKRHYVAVAGPQAISSPSSKKSLEVRSGWKESVAQRKQLLAARFV